MKTAISLPAELFVLADNFAKEHGLSRSELFVTALRNYLAAQRHADLTARINHACENLNTALPQEVAVVSRHKLLEAEW